MTVLGGKPNRQELSSFPKNLFIPDVEAGLGLLSYTSPYPGE